MLATFEPDILKPVNMLRTTVGGIPLDCCVYNASGPRTGTVEALVKIGESEAGAVLSKSATLKKQDGNPLPRFVNKVNLGAHCQGSLNSEGLPNAGIDYYIAKDATDSIAALKKPYIVSISGLSLADNMEMIGRMFQNPANIAGIELNLACPNIPGKPVISNDFEQMENVLKSITEHPQYGSIPLGVKLVPYFDMPFFEKAATIVAKYPVRYVVCINTIGNALFVDADNECEAIAPKNGLGGLGGGFVKHTALANVRTISTLLAAQGRQDIDVVGVGGVQCGRDAFELILCGATAVQVGTCHWTEGPACFGRIAQELRDIMTAKGYKNIEEFRGKLKPYTKPARAPKSSDAGGNDDKEDKLSAKGGAGAVAGAGGGAGVPWRELAIAAYLLLFAILIRYGMENWKAYQLRDGY